MWCLKGASLNLTVLYIGLKFAVNNLLTRILEPISCIASEVQLNLFVQQFQ